MAFELRLVKPTESSGGILGFYRNYPAAAKVLEAWGAGNYPTSQDVDALLDVVLFFVEDAEKPAARQGLIENASIQDVIHIINSLPKLLAAE